MKKLLDSDWLRALQLKSNTSAKSVIPVQKGTPCYCLSAVERNLEMAICTGITLFALVLHFLHQCYSLTALLSFNQNRVMFHVCYYV